MCRRRPHPSATCWETEQPLGANDNIKLFAASKVDVFENRDLNLLVLTFVNSSLIPQSVLPSSHEVYRMDVGPLPSFLTALKRDKYLGYYHPFFWIWRTG